MYFALFCFITAVCLIFYKGAHIVRPTQRGLVESFGRYKRYAEPGFHWITPVIRRLSIVDVSEQVLDTGLQLIITSDNMNAVADAQVYMRVKPDEASVKAALCMTDYNVQIVKLARSTLKNIIGTIPLHQLVIERERISAELHRLLESGTAGWGVEIIRAELGEIEFPRDVQEALNNVAKAKNEKKAAIDFATAAEKAAEGIKLAEIKKAEGRKQAEILTAEGEAKALRIICDAAQQYCTGNAQLLRVLEASDTALKNTVNDVVPNSSRILKALGDLKALPDERERTGTKQAQQV